MWEQKELLTNEECFDAALAIYTQLLMNAGETEEQSLLDLYDHLEVQKILRNKIETSANVKIFKTHDEKKLYLVPNPDNDFLTYSNEELKKRIGLSRNRELYLAFFLMLVLISKFYSSRDVSLVKRQYITVDELLHHFSQHLEDIRKIDSEFLETLSDEYDLDFSAMLEAWEVQTVFKEGTKVVSRTKDNHYGFLLRVLNFYHKERMIHFLQEKEIRISDKLDQIIQHYYYNPTRKEKILSLLEQGFRRFHEEEEK